ncbi:hypothetical protein PSENEW3_00005933 [Picochlorum sp. SENEW3]|nr:hypothetical protein PSENEW3_00005933 [Picochlorum sp. SENEW3]
MGGWHHAGKLLRQVVTQRHGDNVGRALSDAGIKGTVEAVFRSRSFYSSRYPSDDAVSAEDTKTRRSSIEYGRERNAYERDLSNLRKKWRRRRRRNSFELKKQEKRRGREPRLKGMRMAMELDGQFQKIEEARRQKVERRIENVGREFTRQSVIAAFREKRKEVLLEQSRHWIATEAELESRIDAAVENPEPLWVSEKVARKA